MTLAWSIAAFGDDLNRCGQYRAQGLLQAPGKTPRTLIVNGRAQSEYQIVIDGSVHGLENYDGLYVQALIDVDRLEKNRPLRARITKVDFALPNRGQKKRALTLERERPCLR